MSRAQTSTILLSLCSVRLKRYGKHSAYPPELIPLDKCPIPQSMALIATLASALHCQMMIVYSPAFKYLILLINLFRSAALFTFFCLARAFGFGDLGFFFLRNQNVRCFV